MLKRASVILPFWKTNSIARTMNNYQSQNQFHYYSDPETNGQIVPVTPPRHRAYNGISSIFFAFNCQKHPIFRLQVTTHSEMRQVFVILIQIIHRFRMPMLQKVKNLESFIRNRSCFVIIYISDKQIFAHTNKHSNDRAAKTVDDLDAFCDDLFLRFYLAANEEKSKPALTIKVSPPSHTALAPAKPLSAKSTPPSYEHTLCCSRSFDEKRSRSNPQTPIYSASQSPVPSMLNISDSFDQFRNRDIGEIIASNLSITQICQLRLVCRLIANQNGSRFIQRLLKRTNNSQEISLLIKHCMERVNLLELSEDVYGNYIVQLFLSKCCATEQQALLDMFINDNFLRLSKSMYGCRVIQKALSVISDIDLLVGMVSAFREQTKNDRMLHASLICPYRNHVVQAIIDLRLDARYIRFIGQELEQQLVFYCEHIIGSRIVQCFVKNYGDKLAVGALLKKDNHLYLSKLKYGNYVIQCIVDSGAWYANLKSIVQFKNKLIEDVFSHQNILFLSKNKYGSNVVEVCIKVSNKKQKNSLMTTLSRNHYIVPAMVQHCYGCYVVRSLLTESSRQNRAHLIRLVRAYCSESNIKADLLDEMKMYENAK